MPNIAKMPETTYNDLSWERDRCQHLITSDHWIFDPGYKDLSIIRSINKHDDNIYTGTIGFVCKLLIPLIFIGIMNLFLSINKSHVPIGNIIFSMLLIF